jgi:hypothetical protein
MLQAYGVVDASAESVLKARFVQTADGEGVMQKRIDGV